MTGRRPRALLWSLASILVLALPLLVGLQVRWANQLWDAESERTRLEVAEELDALVADLARELMRFNLGVQRSSVGDPSSPTNPRPGWRSMGALAGLVNSAYLWVPSTSSGTSADGTPAHADDLGRWYAAPPRGPLEAVDPPDFADQVASWAGDAGVSGLLPRRLDGERFALSARVPYDGGVDLRASAMELLARGPTLWMTLDRAAVSGWVESRAAEHWRGHLEHLDYRVTATAGPADPDAAGKILFGEPAPPAEPGLGHLRADLDLRQALGETLALQASGCPEGQPCFGGGGGRAEPAGDIGAAEVLLDALGADPDEISSRATVFVSIPSAEERWRIDVWIHRDAIDPQLRELWTRNLAIGLAALGVLGVAVALLVVLTLQSQRLARAQFDFVTGVTHEVRTPLSVLRSASANLADGVVSEAPQVRRYGQVMTKEVRRLGDLVERILGFTRPDDDGDSEVDLQASVGRVLERLADEITERGAAVEISLDPALPAAAAQPWAVDSLVHNLVSNALKYGGDRIWIDAAASRLGRRPAVSLTVSDRGPGLGRAERRRVFEPFFRGRRAKADQQPGTGLGLSWVARLARRYGGRADVESTPGEGSRFTVTLPAAAAAAPSTRDGAARAQRAAEGSP
ncbi:MAG: HAMP domain-containing sensor histidine kinase [Acidobacteriota bacterium]